MDWDKIPDEKTIDTTMEALRKRNFNPIFVPNKAAALEKLIVPNLEMALRRLREHCVPLEDQRMKKSGFPGTYLGKIVIYEREGIPDRITTILVREKLGF